MEIDNLNIKEQEFDLSQLEPIKLDFNKFTKKTREIK